MHAVLVLFRPLPNVGIQNFGMWGMYNLAKAYRSIEIPLPIPESKTGKPAMVTLKIQLNCSTVHDTTLWATIFVRSHLGCGTDCVFKCLCRSHKYFKDAKVMQINKILKISLIWHVKLNQPPKQWDLNQGILHLWPKFRGPSLNRWWVIALKSSKCGKFWLWS